MQRQGKYWEAAAGKVLRELLGMEDYWLAGKGPGGAGRDGLETEEFGGDMQERQVADIAGGTLVGKDHQAVADKDWKGGRHWEVVGNGHHAS